MGVCTGSRPICYAPEGLFFGEVIKTAFAVTNILISDRRIFVY